MAKVVPLSENSKLPLKGQKSRPLCILPVLSKLLEEVVWKQIQLYLFFTEEEIKPLKKKKNLRILTFLIFYFMYWGPGTVVSADVETNGDPKQKVKVKVVYHTIYPSDKGSFIGPLVPMLEMLF